jgi:hypothetical protein
MNALTPLTAHGKAGFRACRETARAIGKASDSAHLQQDRRETAHRAPLQRPRIVVELVSQGETKAHDPFRDGPRLSPAFVTQLLGQMMDQERSRLVRTAYGNAEDRSPRLLDRRF